MSRFRNALLMSAAAAFAVLGMATPAHADSQKLTGRPCVQEWYYNGSGIATLGYRCAQGRVNYVSYSSVLWKINSYDMKYDVSAGLSYGPHNNENPFKVDKGFKSGTQSWLSPDSGNANVGWFNRSGFPDAYTYKGQTVVKIDAYADIPSVGDPRLDCDTATW